ncbi:MAG: MCP four helix bundle domain-containing protein [Eisenbergiella massiliensis]
MKRRFENMKIGRKLIYAFAIIIFLYIITVIISIGNIESMSKRTKQMYNESFANVQSSLAMIAGLQSVGKNITLVLTTDGVVDEQEYLKNIETGIAQSSQELDQLSTGYVSGADKVAELSREYAALTAVRTNMLEKLKAGLKDQALDIYVNQYSVQFNKVKTLLEQVVDLSVVDAAEQLAEGQSMNFKVVVLIISLAVVIILFTIVLCVAITRSIVHPVDEVKRAANAIANGQLKTELTYTSENELGQLADDIRSTAEALNQYVSEVEKGLTALGEGKLNYKPEVVFKGDFIALGNAMEKITGLLRDSLQQIGSSAELVSGGAEQVSNGAQALARGAAEQASSVEELAVSINEIADSVRDNADNAVQSSRLADNVGKSLTESDEQMQGLMRPLSM